jgi:positive regulator of sigma E activity
MSNANNELIQWVLEIIFSNYFIYLSPLIFLFMIALFTDRIVEVLHKALTVRSR